MTEQQLRQIIQDEIAQNANRNVYNTSPIPLHSHNGTDSVRVNPNDLINSQLYFAEKTTVLSSTNILSLFTTPITLVSPFGAGSNATTIINSVIIVEGISAKISAGSAAYAGANNLEFRYTNASGAKVTADIPNTFINTTANTTAWAHVAGITTAFTPVYNSPIIVCVPTANPTTGNGSISISVKYRVISF